MLSSVSLASKAQPEHRNFSPRWRTRPAQMRQTCSASLQPLSRGSGPPARVAASMVEMRWRARHANNLAERGADTGHHVQAIVGGLLDQPERAQKIAPAHAGCPPGIRRLSPHPPNQSFGVAKRRLRGRRLGFRRGGGRGAVVANRRDRPGGTRTVLRAAQLHAYSAAIVDEADP